MNESLSALKKSCFFCYNFTLGEFDEEGVKSCAENWLDAENCPNFTPVVLFVKKRRGFKKIIWFGKKEGE